MTKKENIVICPPCGENVALATKRGADKVSPILPRLPRLTAVLPPQGREMSLGFTLIELLVVVLIIGILAAVAVPQYNKSVYKTHYANLKSLVYTYYKMAKLYEMENNAWPSTFAELSVGAPAGSQMTTPISAECATTGNIYCCLAKKKQGHQETGITCGKTDYSLGATILKYNNKIYCLAKTSNSAAVSVCAQEGSLSSMDLVTPQEHRTGYTVYSKAM